MSMSDCRLFVVIFSFIFDQADGEMLLSTERGEQTLRGQDLQIRDARVWLNQSPREYQRSKPVMLTSLLYC